MNLRENHSLENSALRTSKVLAWSGVVVAVFGLVLLILGGRLALLKGTPFYLLLGVLLTVSGIALALRRRGGLGLYALALVATGAWSLWEVGLDGWLLLPRLFMLAVLGVWLFLPWWRQTRSVWRWSGSLLCLALATAIPLLGIRTSHQRFEHFSDIPAASTKTQSPASAAAAAPGPADWTHYGRTMDGARFSPLNELNVKNVGKLELVWQYNTGDLPRKGETENGREFNFEATPIKVGKALYFCTPHRHVIALEASTGKELWTFDPQGDTSANEYLACRGVAYYEAPAGTLDCPRRIISTSADATLFALDADTGRPCKSFGKDGFVSLRDFMGSVPKGFHFITSQPLVANERVVLGGWIYDNQAKGEPSGVVRAYDPVSGALAWSWDLGRPDPNQRLSAGETFTRGTPNAWGTYTADPTLGLVYLPLGNATPDYFGRDRRPFDDEYSDSIVALDLATGKERWHFQTVHHDVWDFDLPIGPSLVDIPDGHGGITPALVQTTKTGQLYLLDRRNGQPLAKVEERPVPQNGLAGERLAATQPFSVGMPAFTPPDLRESDMWGATPLDQLLCRIDFRNARYDGQYTPPTIGKSIAYPAFDGVVDWQGASIDPQRGLLVANTSYIPFTVETMVRQKAIDKGLIKSWAGFESNEPYPKPKDFAIGPQHGTPYVSIVKPWLGVLGAPCKGPPWGNLVAVDLHQRKIAWQRPLGTTRDMNLFNTHTNVPLPTGMFNIGGSITTAGGLVFVGAAADDYLRAFDEQTGEELWKTRLPFGGQATPMTFEGTGGRQFVVISAGGHGGLRTRNGDAVMAYALPSNLD